MTTWRISLGLCVSAAAAIAAARGGMSPEDRAIAFLEREVPQWSSENKCFSCHNNGDAARALYAAVRSKRPVADSALADTSQFLAQPDAWDRNGVDAEFSDKRLARLQFAAALAAAAGADRIANKQALVRAAELVAADQDPDGSWPMDAAGAVGSPATYGRPLATAIALDVLRGADPAKFREPIGKAEGWLVRLPVKGTHAASAVLLAGSKPADPSSPLAQRAIALLREGQSSDGGWGPFVSSPPEVFDTAVAVLALSRSIGAPGAASLVERGRSYLIATQLRDGSWPETTRPPGAESYAQRLSTTGWATLALLESRGALLAATRKPRETIGRAIEFPQKDAAKWRADRGCATCHHGTMTVWALGEAKADGGCYCSSAWTWNSIAAVSISSRSTRCSTSTSNGRPMLLPARSSSVVCAAMR